MIIFNLISIYLPVGDEFRVFTDSGLGVEGEISGAALLTWVQPVHADVEFLARNAVGVTRVRFFIAIRVELLLGGAFETISQNGGFSAADASFAAGFFGPDADSIAGFEHQITGAGEHILLSIDAREDQVASLLFRVVEETVSSWAVVDGAGRFFIPSN